MCVYCRDLLIITATLTLGVHVYSLSVYYCAALFICTGMRKDCSDVFNVTKLGSCVVHTFKFSIAQTVDINFFAQLNIGHMYNVHNLINVFNHDCIYHTS